jgi:choline-sulfatase
MTKAQKKNIPRNPRARKRVLWLALPALALALMILVPRARIRRQAQRMPGRNVLLITLDTTRADRLGYAGYAAAHTPNLDRLAAAGVHCSEAYSPVPLTLPAHCSVLSGLYPPGHKVRNNGSYFLPEGIDTLAEILARRGYRTSAFVSSFVLDSRFGLDQGFAVYDDDLAAGAAKTYHSERDAASVFAAFSRWLDGQEDGRFFSWVHFFDPHAPYDPPEPYRSAASDPYDGEVAYMDHYIGEIVSLLERKRLLRKTLVVIAGDHGEAFGEHGEHGHQVFCYQENLRVPLIFHAPGSLPPGLALPHRSSLVDVMPTILDLLQLPVPSTLQGRSLLPAMQHRKMPGRDLYLESLFGREAFHCAPVLGIIRDRFKFLDLPRPELYDLDRDPGEKENLVSAAAGLGRKLKAGVRQLAGRLDRGGGDSGRRQSAAERETLATLGYITSGPAPTATGPLPDPKDMIAGWEIFSAGAEQAASGQAGAATVSLLRAIELIPDYAGSYTILANVFFKGGQGEKALALLRDALARLPGDATLKTEYAGLLARMDRPDQAMAQYRELAALGLVDKKAWIETQMAALCETRGDIPQAIRHYRLAYESEPENDDYARKLAYLLHRSQRLAEALDVYLALERRQPEDIQLIRDLAILYAQLNELERARGYFSRALRSAPNANLYFNYALLLARLNETAAAVAAMEKFLATAPPGSAQAEAGRRYLSSWRKR